MDTKDTTAVIDTAGNLKLGKHPCPCKMRCDADICSGKEGKPVSALGPGKWVNKFQTVTITKDEIHRPKHRRGAPAMGGC